MEQRDIDSATRWWLDQWAVSELEADRAAQIDIDELFDEPPVDAVRVALQVLGIALAEVRRSVPDAVGLVYAPLPYSSSIETASPSLREVLGQTQEYGPGIEVVGIYLVTPSVLDKAEDVEECRIDLGSDGLPEGFWGYHRTWRTREDALQGREFARGIYIRSGSRG